MTEEKWDMNKPRYRIESDGTVSGTKVTDLKTGEVIPNVTDIVWQGDVQTGFMAWITHNAPAELHATLPEDVVSVSKRPAEPGEG